MDTQPAWRQFVVTISLVVWVAVSSCVGQAISFEHLTSEQGLSQNSVLAITQDSRGFMWYGTRLGASRYDGHSFRTYKNDPADSSSLTGNYVISLLTDSHKTLWIGTQNGLNQYDPVTDRFKRITHTPRKTSSYGANVINCLYEDRKGQLWVGTNEGLTVLVDRKTCRFRQVLSQSEIGAGSTVVRAIFEDVDGNLWVGTANGLIRLTPGKAGYTSQTFTHIQTDAGSLSDDFITAIVEDRQHTIWIGTLSGGLNRYDKATNTFTRFVHDNANPASLTHNNIRKIALDNRGKLWIGTQEGVSLFDPLTRSFSSYKHDPANKKSLTKNSVYSIYEDTHGTVWIGTYYGGVNVSYANHTHFTVYQNAAGRSSISDDVVSSIIEDKTGAGSPRNLWIATEGGGLNYFDRKTGLFTTYRHNPATPASLGSNLVKFVYQDRRGAVWAGTHGGGLNLFDPVHKTFQRYLFTANDATSLNAEVLSALETSNGSFWVGTQGGIREFESAQPPLKQVVTPAIQQTIKNTTVKVLIEDQQHAIWIGTSNGLFRKRTNAAKLDTFVNEGLRWAMVNCLMEDRLGQIWVGTYHDGLFIYNKQTGAVTNFTTRHGLAHNDVAGILEDASGYVWISTGNGLSRFDPVQKTFLNYTTSDGLPGNDFNYNAALRSSTGELFFGGYQGITSFVPADIAVSKTATPIVFTTLRLFNKPVHIGADDNLLAKDVGLTDAITFRHDQNVFSLEFALLNYIKSNKNRYAYKLDGFDTDWTPTSTPSVTYTNLPAGTYTFWVKGANNDNVWSKPARLLITVLPPFWKTWWAYCLYAALIMGAIFFVIRFFVLRALLERDHELHQVKLAFFTNISHEIRTHLTLIAGPIERLMLARKEDSLVQQQLGYVQKDADRLLKLVTELMDFRKAETNHMKLHVAEYDLVSLLNTICLFFKEVARSKHISVTFVHDADELKAYVDREQLEKVFFNLLSNAYKFTPEGGQICLTLEQRASVIYIRVIDNGLGIAPQYVDKLFANYFQVNDHGIQNTGYGIGLALSKAIVELHKGSIAVESLLMPDAPENRTCFTVSLLAGRAHLEKFIDQPDVPAQRPLANLVVKDDEQARLITVPVLASGEWTDSPGASDWNVPEIGYSPEIPSEKIYSILLVEDNAAVRAFIRESLAERYQVTDCPTGRAGWDAAIEQIPDLIISDVMMPEMDGFTLCNQLKTDERTSHIPVILLTAKTTTANQVSGLAMGADCYLTKPFSLQVLELQIRNLLSARDTMRERFSRRVVLQPQNIEVSSVDERFLNRVMQIIETYIDDADFDVDSLAQEVGMSRSVLYKKLKALTGMSVNDFVKSTRLQKATLLLQQKNLTINEVAYAVGFNDRKYFSKEFKKQFGKAPSDYLNVGPAV